MSKEKKYPFSYLQLSSTYAPSWGYGGPIRMMYEYLVMMLDVTPDCQVIAGDVHHDYKKLNDTGDITETLPVTRVPVYFRELVKRGINLISPSMLLIAYKKIKRSKYPVVLHLWELRGLVPLYAMLLKLWFPDKVVLMHSGFGQLHFKASVLRRIYDYLFLKPLLKRIDVPLAQNEHEMQSYKDYFYQYNVNLSCDIHLLPLHCDLQTNKSLEKASLRKKYSFNDSDTIFIFLGRLNPAKGIARTIEAFLSYAKNNPNSLLLIVGRDEGMQAEIENIIQNHNSENKIKVINDVYEERFEYYSLADVFLGFPIIYEETMLASLEALSCGTPIIVSNEADIPYVQDSKAGFVIEFSNDLAIQKMHETLIHLKTFQDNSVSVVEQYFSSKAIKEKFIHILDQHLKKIK